MRALAAIPTLVVTGPRGAGKTRLIARLLGERPAGETWAALLEDRGTARLDAGAGLAVVRLTAGCPCCVGRVNLRVALARLLRTARPARLFVELDAASHVEATIRLLAGPWLASVLALGPLVEIVAGPGAPPARAGVRQVARAALDGVTLAGLYGTTVSEPR
jgi:G3E family GTPase